MTSSANADRQIDEARKQLEQVAGLTREEAKRSLIDQMVEEAKHESAKRIRVIEEEAKEESVRKSQKIVALAIERLAGDLSPSVRLPSSLCPTTNSRERLSAGKGAIFSPWKQRPESI